MYDAELATLEDPQQKVVRLFKLAELRCGPLKDAEGAARCYRDILTLSPGYIPAVKALATLYSEAERYQDLVELHEEELKDVKDRDQSIFLLNRVAHLWEHRLGQPEKAVDALERILKVAPIHLPTIHALGRLFFVTQRWTDLLHINALEADLSQDQKQVLALLQRNGEILEENLGDKTAAIAAYRKVLTLRPNYLPALKALGRLYGEERNYKELVAMYHQEAEVTRQPDHRVDLLYRAGIILHEELADAPNAIAAFQEVLREKPDHHPSVRALMRVHLERQDYGGVVEMAQQEAALFSNPTEQAHALYRAGEILGARLGRPVEAAAMFQRALELHPSFEAAVSALVGLASVTGDIKAEHEALRRMLVTVPKGPRWVPLAQSLAELLGGRLGEHEAALQLYDQILEVAPEDTTTLRAALTLSVQHKDWPRAMALASKLAALEPSAQAAASLHTQIAAWKLHNADPPEDPIPEYLKALEYAPADMVALRAVERAYRKTQSLRALLTLYERERAYTEDQATQMDLCVQIADVATQLQEPERAVSALEHALGMDGAYLPALRRLARLYDTLGRHADRLKLLVVESESTKDPSRACAMLMDIADAHARDSSSLDTAIRCYFNVLDRDPQHAGAWEKLDTLLVAHERWADLHELLTRKAGLVTEPEQRANVLCRLAELLVDRLHQTDQGLQLLLETVRLAPKHASAMRRVAELHDAAGRAQEALQAYAALLQVSVDESVVLDAHRRMAHLCQQLGDIPAAAQHYGTALAARPSDLVLAGELTDLYLQQGAWPQAAEMLGALAERAPSPDERVTYYQRLALVLQDGLQDARRAVECHQKILELRPDDTHSLSRLLDLSEQLGDVSALPQIYAQLMAAIPPAEKARRAALRTRLGLLYANRLNAPDKALGELRTVLETDPENVDARSALADLYSHTPGSLNAAVEEHRRILTSAPLRMDTYHALWALHDNLKQRDHQYTCAELLHHFGQANDAERFFYSAIRSKPRLEADAALSETDVETLLVHPHERGPLREMVRRLAPELHKVFPAEMEAYGVGKGDRHTFKSQETSRRLLDNTLRLFGATPEQFDLYFTRQKPKDVAYVNTDPPALVIGVDALKRHSTQEQRFILGQAVMGLISGHQMLEGMTPEQFDRFVHAACWAVDDTVPSDLDAKTQELSRRIGKAMSRGTRKLLVEPVGRLRRSAPRMEAVTYLRAARLTRWRAGILFSGDADAYLPQCAQELGLTYSATDLADVQRKLNTNMFRDVFPFLVSDDYATLRQRLRLAVDS
jgi:tetratricopeptide (TPR) repeat protein